MANYAILLVCYKHSETKVYNVIFLLPPSIPFFSGKRPEVSPSVSPVAAFFLVNSAMENNGFTKLPNTWIESLAKSNLTGEQIKVFLIIARQTIGFQREWTEIKNKQFVEMTGLKPPNICRTIQNLLSRVIIDVITGENKSRKYAINKDFQENLLSRVITTKNKDVITGDNRCYHGREQVLSPVITPLYNKENLKKNLKNKECANAPKNQKKELPIQKQIPPPIELVIMKFQELGYPGQSGIEKAHAFFDHYQSNGWKVGGRTKMVDWVAAIRNWIRRDKEFQSNRKPDKLPMVRGKDDGVGGKFEQYKA